MKKPEKTKKNPKTYSGTYKYYVKYRPGIPEEVINIIVKHFDIKPSDRILDIGCGTGQVALAMEGKCGEMVCLDPNLEMLKQAEKATQESKIKLTWIYCSAEDLGKFKEKLGIFKVATCSRAFHRMDQDKVLKKLDGLIKEDGGVAVFSDRALWNGKEKWQRALKKVIHNYLEKEWSANEGKSKEPEERWEDILARSVFKFVKTYDVPIKRIWNIESIIGYIFSTAAAAPYLFGAKLSRFKEETKTILLSINPKGIFTETAVWSIVLGSKKPRE